MRPLRLHREERLLLHLLHRTCEIGRLLFDRGFYLHLAAVAKEVDPDLFSDLGSGQAADEFLHAAQDVTVVLLQDVARAESGRGGG